MSVDNIFQTTLDIRGAKTTEKLNPEKSDRFVVFLGVTRRGGEFSQGTPHFSRSFIYA